MEKQSITNLVFNAKTNEIDRLKLEEVSFSVMDWQVTKRMRYLELFTNVHIERKLMEESAK